MLGGPRPLSADHRLGRHRGVTTISASAYGMGEVVGHRDAVAGERLGARPGVRFQISSGHRGEAHAVAFQKRRPATIVLSAPTDGEWCAPRAGASPGGAASRLSDAVFHLL